MIQCLVAVVPYTPRRGRGCGGFRHVNPYPYPSSTPHENPGGWANPCRTLDECPPSSLLCSITLTSLSCHIRTAITNVLLLWTESWLGISDPFYQEPRQEPGERPESQKRASPDACHFTSFSSTRPSYHSTMCLRLLPTLVCNPHALPLIHRHKADLAHGT